jgi:restriction system protein
LDVAEITGRRRGELLQAVLRALVDHPEGLPATEVLRRVEQSAGSTDFEKSEYPNRPGVRRFEKIVRFSTIGAVKGGWLVKNKGQWILTDEGRNALAAFPAPELLYRESGRLYRIWRKGQPDAEDTVVEEVEEAESPSAAITLEEAEETAREAIHTYLAAMAPYDFQNLVAALLRAMNYHVAWVAPPGPDKGVDIVAYNDPLGATGPRIKVQVKRRADKIAVQEVRSFMAVLSSNDVGIFVTTGGFTSEAHAEARHQESRRVSLLTMDDLIDLWVEHYGRMPEPDKQLLPLRPIYYLAPS